MILFIIIPAIIFLSVMAFMSGAKFGQIRDNGPEQASPNWKDGQFQNLHPTPALAEGVTYWQVLKEFFWTKHPRKIPTGTIPSVKTDLLSLDPSKNVLIWFGHSSYFIQVDGKKILVDPVFSGAASPISFTTRSFPGTDMYTVEDMPPIDYLFLSHDHWDHLDHETMLKLEPKVKKVITGLGTGAHLERWGYDMRIVSENDWNTSIDLGDGFTTYIKPSRHFSGRTFKRNKALWVSFVLQTPNKKLYLGGDSGYDTHFKEIGDAYGPFDLAILECGQYDNNWKYIHMLPFQVAQAASDLHAKKLLPVHWAKFALANHEWDAPIMALLASKKDIPIVTPMIGEPLYFDEQEVFSKWWIGVDN